MRHRPPRDGFAQVLAGGDVEAVVDACVHARQTCFCHQPVELRGTIGKQRAQHLALGDKDRALTWLERAHEERDGWLTHANVEPTFDDLRDEPRFRAILTKMGFR